MEVFNTEVDKNLRSLLDCGVNGKSFWRMTIDNLTQIGKREVLCLECAASYHGLSTFSGYDSLKILVGINSKEYQYKRILKGNISFYGIDKIDYSHCIPISETVYVTDIPLTICQMIQFDCHEFHMFEAIDDLYTFHGDLVKETEELAKSFGILDKLLKYRELAEQAYEEDNE